VVVEPQIKGKYYWGSQPVAYYSGGATHFEHQDWLGTERLRTTYNASVEGTFTSLPWGDGQVTSGSDGDANHYATLDHDTETNTDYAQFRQYSSAQGRWFSPDPYSGSYDVSNPQSMNRYAYVANNPVSYVDPQGLLKIDPCPSGRCNNAVGGTFSDIYNPMGDGSIWSTALNGVIITTIYSQWVDEPFAGGSFTTSFEFPGGDATVKLSGGYWDTWSIVDGFGGGSPSVPSMDQGRSGSASSAPNNPLSPQQQQQKRKCSDLEKASYVWHGVETIGTVAVGGGLAVTGVLGGVAACTAGEVASPLLCAAALPAAAAAVYTGYKIATSSWDALRTPNNPEFGADCQP